MAVHTLQKGQLKRPARQATGAFRIPAPQQGVDARVPVSEGALPVCTYTYNLVPADGGLDVRKGYAEHQIEVESVSSEGVHTIIPFDGVVEDGTDNRLFAVTNEGIWDVSVAEAAPVLKYTFLDQDPDAGYGPYVHFISDAGVDVLFYADSVNGLMSYDVLTDTWAPAAGITGVAAVDVRFVTMHKQRVWLVEGDTTNAWYLAVGAITGAATKFTFGGKFRRGGALRGMFSWSVDGGEGVDDMLVAVSRAGDVVVYQGADPSSADTWEIRGVYYIGALPKGTSFGTESGGELYLLSTYGVTSMNDLLQGGAVPRLASETGTAGKIAGLLRARMATDRELRGWAIADIPSEGGLLVSSPTTEGSRPIQAYYNYAIDGWGLWRDVPITSFATQGNYVIFGTADNRVMEMSVELDNVLITAPPSAEVNGDPIEFSILSSFSSLGAPAVFKRVHYIRPDFIGTGRPTFFALPRYDYSSIEARKPVASKPNKIGVWDSDSWDAVVWGADDNQGSNKVYGGWGTGRYVAVAMKGYTYNTLTLVGWDVMFDKGGPML